MNTEQLKTADKTLLDQIKDDVAKEMKDQNFWVDQKHFDNEMQQSPAVEKFWILVCEKYATAKAQASRLLPAEEKKDFHDFLGQVAIEAQKTDRTIGNSFDEAMNQNNDDKPHSYTESVYKEGEALEPNEKDYFKCPSCGDKIRYGLNEQTREAFRKSKLFTPYESQEELWKIVYGASNTITRDGFIDAMKEHFTITRNP